MYKQEVSEHGYQYYINDAAETIARLNAEKVDDIQILQRYLKESSANGEENISLIYLQQMFKATKFSSDYIDIAKILQKHAGLQDHLSITECIDKAKTLAKVPGDWLEIQQFADNYAEKESKYRK